LKSNLRMRRVVKKKKMNKTKERKETQNSSNYTQIPQQTASLYI